MKEPLMRSPRTKKEKFETYTAALESLHKIIKYNITRDMGLCIILGDVLYGNFFDCPWGFWDEFVDEMPDFEPFINPATTELEGGKKAGNEQRILILEELIERYK